MNYEEEFNRLLEEAKGIKDKLSLEEYDQYRKALDTYKNPKDRVSIIRLWLSLVRNEESSEPNLRQQKYLKIMESLNQFR